MTASLTTPSAKTLAAALAVAFALVPAATLAQGCPHAQQTIKMTCAEGTAWDDQTRKCEPIVGA